MSLLSKLAYAIFNNRAPTQGPRALKYDFVFDINTPSIQDDLLTENTRGDMQFVQSMYIDNSSNANPFTIKFLGTNQSVTCPAFSQGTFPCFSPDQTQFVASTVAANGLTVPVHFLNIPQPYMVWGPNAISGTVSATQGTIPWVVAGTVPPGVADDGSAPVKAGGVFNTTPPTLLTGQRGDVQLDALSRLLAVANLSFTSTDATTNLAGFPVPTSLAARIGAIAAYMFNGTNWDRLRGAVGTTFFNSGLNVLQSGNNFSHLNTAVTTTIKSGAGYLGKINVNSGVAASTVTVFDNTSGAGTIIAVIDASTKGAMQYDIAFANGLTIVQVGIADITVSWR